MLHDNSNRSKYQDDDLFSSKNTSLDDLLDDSFFNDQKVIYFYINHSIVLLT